ncbi:hypothetical protein NKI82_32585 [Mesorhizobium sp. M0482]|uniref:hypothetical protein n=1 Tax=Mesorhizobium sp. M0482 TaxID=2956948 RepID=UPI00333CEDFB
MDMIEFNGQNYFDGRASDPNEIGWMHGAPPQRITSESDAFLDLPQLRWSLSHMRELVPTVSAWRGPGGRAVLDRDDSTSDVDLLTFADADRRVRRFNETPPLGQERCSSSSLPKRRSRTGHLRMIGDGEPAPPEHNLLKRVESHRPT